MILKKKALSIVMAAMMAFSVTAVGVFADDNTVTVLNGVQVIGAAPFAGATNVAPGNNNAKQPVRIALSDGADIVAENINSYILLKDGSGNVVTVTASTDGDIVVLTPASVLSSGTTYTVDFDETNLPDIDDYTFTTSQGGTGAGGGTGTGGQQALTLTGQIPANGETVLAGQNLYAVFSNSLLPGTTNNSGIADLKTHNLGKISVKDMSGNAVTGYTVDITDNWTVKITTSNLGEGDYQIVINTLTANSGKTYSGKTIPFSVVE